MEKTRELRGEGMILRIRWGYIGAALIFCAIVVRIFMGGDIWEDPRLAGFLTYFYTGKIVSPEPELPQIQETKPIPEKTEDPLQISLQAGLSIAYKNSTAYDISLEALLKAPLNWDLTGEKPCVLIIHTHATESYKNTGQYTSDDAYRTTDEAHNMVAVGERLAELLRAGGISVIHDRTLHDYPTYNDAYTKARETIADYLAQNEDICLVLDIHRDAIADENGNQLPMTATFGNRRAARLALVVGTDAGGQAHPHWQKNAALAAKLQTVLEGEFPGICRPILFRSSRYNQDLTTGSLIVEVGAAGNGMSEALAGVEVLAKAIIKLSKGAEIIDS